MSGRIGQGTIGRPASARAAGFTLLELLVALTVLGVLTALLSSGLNFGARVWEREGDQLQQWSELQTTQEVVRRLLSQAWPLGGALAGSAQGGSFVGSDTAMQFFGPPPAQSLIGGIYQYSIVTRTDARGTRLVLVWQQRTADGSGRIAPETLPDVPPEEQDRLRAGKEVVLVDGIAAAQFSFFGAGEGGSGGRWQDRWQDAGKMPSLVRVQVTFPPGDRRNWPPLLVAPRISGVLGEG